MIYPDKVDIQIKEMDNENLLAIAKSIHKQGVVVFYNQKLNESEYINTMKRFGECEYQRFRKSSKSRRYNRNEQNGRRSY